MTRSLERDVDDPVSPRGPTLSARRLNRATLARQRLAVRRDEAVVDAVEGVTALQAQQAASPYVALWNRVAGLRAEDVASAFLDGRLLKVTLFRSTLHVVSARDYPVVHDALQPMLRGALRTRFFNETGFAIEDADDVVPDLLAFGAQARPSLEYEAWLEDRLGGHGRVTWSAIRNFGPFRHAPTSDPWTFGHRATYVASRASVPNHHPENTDAALVAVARRYLQGFGPATVADFSQFTAVSRGRARAALVALGDDLVTYLGPNDALLYDLVGAELPDDDAPAPPRLMAMWDSALLAYQDRRRVVPERYRALVTRTNGDVLPTLLVDGHVAGLWRLVDDGVEAVAFEPLRKRDVNALRVEAAALRAFLVDRDPRTYRRYDHWWDKTVEPEDAFRLI